MMNDYSFVSIITATLGRAERFTGRACQQPGLMKKRENLENKRTHKKKQENTTENRRHNHSHLKGPPQ